MIKFISKLFGDKKAKDVKALQPIVTQTNEWFNKYNSFTDDQLRNKSFELRKRIQDHVSDIQKEITSLKEKAQLPSTELQEKEDLFKQAEKLSKDLDKKIEEVLLEICPEAFAVVKETARRLTVNKQLVVTATQHDRDIAAKQDVVRIEGDKAIWPNTWTAAGTPIKWEMVHYDVQLMGGFVLHQGKIAEMQTGEGKTLVATLPIFLNALAGMGVHIVTVNDYLSKRDSEWNAPLFMFHGLTVDCIDKHEPNSPARRNAYAADITYGTNNEFGFDYLRDNMTNSVEMLVQRKHHFAIVDEVDSVLVDDARTPLIISGPTPKGNNQEYHSFKPKIDSLVNEQKKYLNIALADAKKLLANLNDENVADKKQHAENLKNGGMALLRCHRGFPKNKALIKFLSETGVKAHLQKTEGHYIQDHNKEMPKIDAELYFVIDEKNNSVELTDKGIDFLSRGEDKSYYVIPDMGTEIAKIEAMNLSPDKKAETKDSLIRDYTIKAERIHTMNQLLKAYALFERDVEYVIMDGKVKIVDESTGRILDGRRYSDGLHQAIEAKENVKIEDPTQTYATITLQNYFRMYHKLAGMTGTAETEAKEFWDIYKLDVVCIPTNRGITRKDEQDLVYKTNREKFNAVIEDVVKLREAGRPILVGTTSVEISELLSRMLKMRNIPHQVLNAKLHQKEADIVANAGLAGTVTIATNMAGRGTDIKLGPGVKEAGGLAIMGTERHESRRVDRQLRGRAGRQGDPGSSQFYVSLEDPLMRMFGSERIAKMMDRLGHKEGDVIQHRMISKSIERAQKKVEENNFGMRKRLLEYDDVLNGQRNVIYEWRRNALFGEKLELDVMNMLYNVSDSVVNQYHESKDYEGFTFELLKTLGIESPVDSSEFANGEPNVIADKVFDTVLASYQRKWASVSERALPVITNVYETQGSQFENIVIPITDGMKNLQCVVNLKESVNLKATNIKKTVERSSVLAIIDQEWKEHLREMDDLRQSVQGAVYEQKDPLVIYKLESYQLFDTMRDKVNRDIVSFLTKANLPSAEADSNVKGTMQKQQVQQPKNLQTSRTETGAQQQTQQQAGDPNVGVKQQPVRVEKKVGRNDPCPCGSGKKYKNCHGTEA
ncbi:MAG TPA: preprotein translocase subunit SecA [Flavobacteriales bacterium]|nr:preprotein translocase subunit SecA [Flavobacteriales bacterium]